MFKHGMEPAFEDVVYDSAVAVVFFCLSAASASTLARRAAAAGPGANPLHHELDHKFCCSALFCPLPAPTRPLPSSQHGVDMCGAVCSAAKQVSCICDPTTPGTRRPFSESWSQHTQSTTQCILICTHALPSLTAANTRPPYRRKTDTHAHTTPTHCRCEHLNAQMNAASDAHPSCFVSPSTTFLLSAASETSPARAPAPPPGRTPPSKWRTRLASCTGAAPSAQTPARAVPG